MGLPDQFVTAADLVNGTRNVVEWPHLSVMRMARELKVNSQFHGALQVERLVVEEDHRAGKVNLLGQFVQLLALLSGKPLPVAVFAPYKVKAVVYKHRGVTQHGDSMLAEIFHGRFNPSNVLMVPGNGVNTKF